MEATVPSGSLTQDRAEVGSLTRVSWPAVVGALVLVILLIPIKRYALPGGAAFDLEPYRLAIALVLLAWLAALLVDPAVRLRLSGFEASLGLLVAAALGSELANPARVDELGTPVTKSLSILLSYLLVFVFVVSVIRTRRQIDAVIKTLVAGGAVVAFCGLVESRTNYNVFDHLEGIIPMVSFDPSGALSSGDIARGGRLRIYASAQHPIALAAMLVMLLPLGLYLARTSSRSWWMPVAVTALAVFATQSRTGIVMTLVVGVTFMILRPRAVLARWPIVLGAIVAAQVALPGTVGNLREAFFPSGGLVAQQSNVVNNNRLAADGRLADLGPSLDQLASHPLLGLGYGTRITVGPGANAAILDNAWLGTLLELGIVGSLALAWLFVGAIWRLGSISRRDRSDLGRLCTALAASIAAFAVGMFTYDAFSFIQVTIVLFLLLALAAAAVRSDTTQP